MACYARAMTALQATLNGSELTLVGPGGAATVAVASVREPEAGDRDRVSLELTMEVDVEGQPRPRILLWAYTHDSYDGEHRDVLEEGVVCKALIARVNEATGASVDVEGLLALVAGALPDFADVIACLRAELDSADVTDQLYGPNLE